MRHTNVLKLRLTVVALIIAILFIGCEQEITRQADWETDFTALHFVDAKHGWIVGTKGMIIHTNDGGKTWERQESGTERDFQSIYFTNNRNGWAVGAQGLIAATDVKKEKCSQKK